MTILSEFERKAWLNRGSAEQHKPAMVLKFLLDEIERGNINPVHIIVVSIEREPSGTEFISASQAGDLTELATEGALFRAMCLSRDSG